MCIDRDYRERFAAVQIQIHQEEFYPRAFLRPKVIIVDQRERIARVQQGIKHQRIERFVLRQQDRRLGEDENGKGKPTPVKSSVRAPVIGSPPNEENPTNAGLKTKALL